MLATVPYSHPFAAIAGALGGAVLVASPASAHVGHATHGFGTGFLHPLTGPDHLLAMVAVGVVAATWRTDRTLWSAPASFLLGMVAGGLGGIIGVPFPGAEVLIAASVLLWASPSRRRSPMTRVRRGSSRSWPSPAWPTATPTERRRRRRPTPRLYIGGFLLANRLHPRRGHRRRHRDPRSSSGSGSPSAWPRPPLVRSCSSPPDLTAQRGATDHVA